MKLIVDNRQRNAKMRAHTATHLMHAQIDKMLGGTKQAGSYVDEDYLRLDFSTQKPFTDTEIQNIEKNVNEIIYQSHIVEKMEMSMNDAIKLGAKAFFEDKYGDIVRVIKVGDDISIELCGGTHADNTAQIGAFKIIGQEAVASGIRRLIGVTGPKVAEYAMEKDNFLNEIGAKIQASAKQIPEKLDKMNSELSMLKAAYESAQSNMITDSLKALVSQAKSNDQFKTIINSSNDPKLKEINFKDIVQKLKELTGNESFIIFNNDGNFAIQGPTAKSFAQTNGIKGGGSDNFVQGRDMKILEVIK